MSTSRENLLNKPLEEIKEKFKKAMSPTEAYYNAGLYLQSNALVKNIKGIKTNEFEGENSLAQLKKFIADNGYGAKIEKELLDGFENGNYAAVTPDDTILLFKNNAEDSFMSMSGSRGRLAAVSAFHEVGHIQARQAGIVKNGEVVGDANSMMDGILSEI